jgi:uncharacterized protein YqgV (UPF0045/DUF77 family)
MVEKRITLLLEDAGLRLEFNAASTLITVCLNDFVLDEEATKSGHEVFKEKNKVEVFLDVYEVKEIIKALQQVLPEVDEDE